MKTLLRISAVALVLIFAASALHAQEWTKAQKEVWQVVEDSWAKTKTWDIDGLMSYIHEKYQGWNQEAPLPMTKEQVAQYYNEMKGTSKVESISLNPARIVVTENAAVVDYYFYFKATNTVGEKKEAEEVYGKNVEFYVKEKGKWLLLGDMTFFKEKENK